MDQSNAGDEVGKIPQQGNGEVDSEVKKAEASRARTQLESLTAAELAKAIETHSLSPKDMDLLLAMPVVKAKAAAAIVRALDATKFYFDKALGGMVHVPDFPVQLAAGKLICERTEGLPVLMTMNVNATVKQGKGDDADSKWTPASVTALERTLARLKRQQKAGEGATEV